MPPVGREWAEQNLGMTIPERRAMPEALAPGKTPASDRQLARELIDFDSEGPAGAEFRAAATRAPDGLSKYVDIEWPAGLEPTPGPEPEGEPLPRADVLLVTWTVDEGHALSRVLTPGFDSRDQWKHYAHNYEEISKDMLARSPARQYGRLGTYWTTTIGARAVTLVKSDSHMSQDGPKLPNARLWAQMIQETQPRLVISTGTGGGIGPDFEVGDVIVSRFAEFDCQRAFTKLDGEAFSSPRNPHRGKFTTARSLFKANAKMLPATNTRPPRIFTAASRNEGILTTDFFGFDNTANTYGLQGKGDLSEMGDAVLGMVCAQLGAAAPSYVIVRNVSDPQIDASTMTLDQQKDLAAKIYKGYGRWSSVCGALVCWAIIAGL